MSHLCSSVYGHNHGNECSVKKLVDIDMVLFVFNHLSPIIITGAANYKVIFVFQDRFIFQLLT